MFCNVKDPHHVWEVVITSATWGPVYREYGKYDSTAGFRRFVDREKMKWLDENINPYSWHVVFGFERDTPIDGLDFDEVFYFGYWFENLDDKMLFKLTFD